MEANALVHQELVPFRKVDVVYAMSWTVEPVTTHWVQHVKSVNLIFLINKMDPIINVSVKHHLSLLQKANVLAHLDKVMTQWEDVKHVISLIVKFVETQATQLVLSVFLLLWLVMMEQNVNAQLDSVQQEILDVSHVNLKTVLNAITLWLTDVQSVSLISPRLWMKPQLDVFVLLHLSWLLLVIVYVLQDKALMDKEDVPSVLITVLNVVARITIFVKFV